MSNLPTRNWAAIVGRWSIAPSRVQYIGPQSDYPHALGLCLTNLELTEGSITVRVKLSDGTEGRILLGYRGPTENYLMVGLRGWNFAYSIGEFDPEVGWQGLAAAGIASNLSSDIFYEIRADVVGRRISLTVDGVKVLDHQLEKPIREGQTGLFAWGPGPVEFERFDADPRLATAFVVMEFSEAYIRLYEEVIQPVVQNCGLRAYHGGEVFGPGMILHDIQQGINEATIVVAEITPTNANVFYELGYAHALGKPTVLLAERGKQLPFDISGYRVLFYENTPAGKTQLRAGLRRHLEAILKE